MELWVKGIWTIQSGLKACEYGDFAGFFYDSFVIEYGGKEPKAFSCLRHL